MRSATPDYFHFKEPILVEVFNKEQDFTEKVLALGYWLRTSDPTRKPLYCLSNGLSPRDMNCDIIALNDSIRAN